MEEMNVESESSHKQGIRADGEKFEPYRYDRAGLRIWSVRESSPSEAVEL